MSNNRVTVVHCWSAPRSRSTALLYSFEARGDDCVAIDEPLYREWLIAKKNVVERPYKTNLIEGTSPDGTNEDKWQREKQSLTERIQQGVNKFGAGGGVVFCKHMAKHSFLYDFGKPDEGNVLHKHVLLVRDPVSVLSSWKKSGDAHGNSPSADETGIVPMLGIYSVAMSSVVVLDADDLSSDPPGTLSTLCHDLEIPYRDQMLVWKEGPHACDGPWAPWWYTQVHQSSGWITTSNMAPRYPVLDRALMPALRASMPTYQFLKTLTKQGPNVYEDPRNADLLVWIGAPNKGGLVPRELAAVSPWDSSVQGGDAAWEGLRVYRGKILSFDKHLNRLFRSAKALGFQNTHTREEVTQAIFRTLAANGMRDGAHMRLTLTRGQKSTSSMNPAFNVYGTTLIVLPEWKPVVGGATTYDNTKGITLVSASQRRNPPSTVDSKIHHNNMINNILPKIQANLAGAADAIMLDVDGYVSETNATNIFMVDDEGTLLTPHADHCLPGITRQTVLTLARELEIPCEVRRVTLAEFHAAEECFTTGTMGELTPVTMIDGRVIGSGVRGNMTKRLQDAYKLLPERPGWATAIPEFH